MRNVFPSLLRAEMSDRSCQKGIKNEEKKGNNRERIVKEKERYTDKIRKEKKREKIKKEKKEKRKDKERKKRNSK